MALCFHIMDPVALGFGGVVKQAVKISYAFVRWRYIPGAEFALYDRSVMVALWNTADHYNYFHVVVCSSFFFLLFFPRLISAAADWMSAILAHMVWP